MSVTSTAQPALFVPTELDWTFRRENTREMTHCYHDYPARMIPQIPRQFLEIFGKDKKGKIFDPYCGTGTTLVEGFIRGFDVVGLDLNPLARLIAAAKTTVVDLPTIDSLIAEFGKYILRNPKETIPEAINGISRLDFWFKPEVLEHLSAIKAFIGNIKSVKARLFFLMAFSETVRESSNTRTHEFKLYRYNEETLKTFEPDAFAIMSGKLHRNRKGLAEFLNELNGLDHIPTSNVFEFNSVEDSPSMYQDDIDFVLTSPPYGDSHTTVAYGQYSRLSAAWLDLPHAEKIDSKLMGSGKRLVVDNFDSKELDVAIKEIASIDIKRAIEVSGFYVDLQRSVDNVSKLVKKGGHACYVVGNRKVKGVVLPTDIAVKDFFEKNGFQYLKTFHRSIPNKRMPARNSPSNVTGITHETMSREYIVVLKKVKQP